ncbi:hypothetical protein K490DRAFT_46498 [Saccharata proteae CBS 121410]|uniref:F-box domain-containing protein n=1 Tax=Saccharata proteae CBS 121410 TaxID=1314787 RepID=A0A9P4LV06_9PEZI|nr:hypothetical protein K490DRAFT_46498 [Saccharata proteae CBS 121410]
MIVLDSLVAATATPSFWTAILVIVVSLPLLILHRQSKHTKPQEPPFPFLRLPAELRNLVYEELVDHRHRPTFPPRDLQRRPLSCLRRLMTPKKVPTNRIAMMLVSRQVSGEYNDVLCKRARFTLDVAESNARRPDLWSISKEVLSRVRDCKVRIHATSRMLGAVDPRSMPRQWELRNRVADCLEPMQKVESLHLHVHAIPDPLWNPLWMWYHISQHFKELDGPAFTGISFDLAGSWTLGENHLGRDRDGRWQWRCAMDHAVLDDTAGWQPIREFCAALYVECRVCQRAEAASEEDEA